MMMKR